MTLSSSSSTVNASAAPQPDPLPPLDPATAYAVDVVEGRRAACRYVRLACARHLRDLVEGPARGLSWHPELVEDLQLFFFGLRHSKGEWAGRPIELEPWELFMLGSVVGWLRADGTRRFRVAYVEVPRKNGKSTAAAGLALKLAFYDEEAGAEVYAAATKRDQAKIVWLEAKRMVLRSPRLRERITTLVANLNDHTTGSKFEPLGADADNLDGLNIHAAIVDELHAHKTRAMYDVLDTATGARRQSLIFSITTAGNNQAGVCYEQRLYLIKVLEGAVQDDSTFGLIFTIDDGDRERWWDPVVWAKANPNLGVSVKLDDLERQAKKARESSSSLPAFLTKRLNVWMNADSPWLRMDLWAKLRANFTLEDLRARGADFFFALDLASKHDVAALVILAKLLEPVPLAPADPEAEAPRAPAAAALQARYYLSGRYFLPEERVHAEGHASTAHFEAWHRDGHLILTPGTAIDFNDVEQRVRELAGDVYPVSIGYDEYQAVQLATTLEGEGLPMIQIPMTVKQLSPAMKELETLVIQGRVHHDGNPCLDWMVSNVVCHRDAKDNVYPRKSAFNLKIDGAVAAIMAMSRAMIHVKPTPGSLLVL